MVRGPRSAAKIRATILGQALRQGQQSPRTTKHSGMAKSQNKKASDQEQLASERQQESRIASAGIGTQDRETQARQDHENTVRKPTSALGVSLTDDDDDDDDDDD
eukprot:CAMPEP_0116835512 /NCGR_PEP_ID=MMETSP0418-20121206/7586_1 /TAXON_ID=1158023 /ORGANISM="Astrosyne radiata, Strain 13vi08-1A" /LENGTH=104 /DNA_ID=CAMNT_0004465187 /DNA_START=601 /DNA_END=912 /DNA_ORIENTATION=+